ncbi:MAG: winged helix-turn-helix transcriptional regulator [Dehalococcoidia bacterium]|nr:winged helix-turn-helix transcriptional regulator [Dehalococcoidia bacterium]
MPAELAREPRAEARVTATVSLPIELTFALFMLSKPERTHDRAGSEQLARIREQRPDLVDRVRAFWAEADYPEWGELLLLTNQAGALLEDDIDRLIARLMAAAAQPVEVPDLPTEPPEVRGYIAGRLQALRTDPARRDRLAAILHDTWEYAVLPGWEGDGRTTAEQTAQRIARQLESGTDLTRVVPANHLALREGIRPLLNAALRAGHIYVVPMSVTSSGQCVFGTAETLLISFGPEAGSKAKRRREQAEAAAGRFKVLSDPTRVAILTRVLQMPTSITDLALYFDLSQPTVSVHMKMLREAGLLESTRSGAQTLYSASSEHVRDFVRQAGEIITDEELIGC